MPGSTFGTAEASPCPLRSSCPAECGRWWHARVNGATLGGSTKFFRERQG